MVVIMAIPNLIKLIRELMAALQEEMGPGTGAEKKATVMETVAGVVGNETVWEKVKGIFSWVIDCIAIFKPKTS